MNSSLSSLSAGGVSQLLIQAKQTREKANRLRAQGQAARDKATRLQDRARNRATQLLNGTRELLLTFGLAPAISGASDARVQAPISVWIAPSQGRGCDACGRPIAVGEMAYHVVAQGRETHLHHPCYRLHFNGLSSKAASADAGDHQHH